MVILYSFTIGLAVGTVFFGGLKLTLEYAQRVRHPVLLWLSSYFGRTVLLLGALFLMARHSGLPALLSGAAGILVVQVLSMILTRRGGTA